LDAIIKDYISRELVQDPTLLPLADETSLIEGDVLDSLNLLRLVVFLEERFDVTIGEADLHPANFASVKAICAYLHSRDTGKLQAVYE
jgi:acyl carrier protein